MAASQGWSWAPSVSNTAVPPFPCLVDGLLSSSQLVGCGGTWGVFLLGPLASQAKPWLDS